MSRYDDDWADMGAIFDDDGSGRSSAAAVAQFIDELRAIGDEAPPQPSPELAAVLGGATPLRRRSVRRYRRRVVLIGAAAVLGGTSFGAATGQLPQPAQRMVSNVFDHLTPFSVPAQNDPEHHPNPVVPGRLVSSTHPAPSPHHRRSHVPPPAPDPEPNDREDPGGSGGSGASDDPGEPAAPAPTATRDDGAGPAGSAGSDDGGHRGGTTERAGDN